MIKTKINFKELKNLTDKKLLKLANKVYELYDHQGILDLVDEVTLNYFINEVSKRHYGIDDVNNVKDIDEYLCFDEGGFVKMVKEQSAKKFLNNADECVCIMNLNCIKWLDNVNGDIYFTV
ncbi:MAG: hypothetical protein IKG40_01280 [Bacilli bacterium]|nr:hypothetical protein [Bacilli bacterium]